ncbi:hypothetical protein DPMN_179189 [Dreissena polymorpha]|uniref:Uncharacterized protein n=1 Tax=Dreissena polymorpha TaxID=45954 RepID=A0A9D4IJC5_DREPO|nr:hypothetical protein DPMN_179189 [Dreissena polymorpha]
MEEGKLQFEGLPTQPLGLASDPLLTIALQKGEPFVTERNSYTFEVYLTSPIPLTKFDIATTATNIELHVHQEGSPIGFNLSVSV